MHCLHWSRIIKKNISFLWIFIHISFICGQRITLHEYRQEDSKTQCLDGLIDNFDTVIFSCQLEYPQNTTVKGVEFQIKKYQEAKFNQVIDFDFKSESAVNGSAKCKFISDRVYNLTINIKASVNLSQAMLRGILDIGRSSPIISEEQMFPIIRGINDTVITVIANNKKMATSIDKCAMNVSGNDVYLVNSCKSQLSPCLIQIKVDNNEFNFKDIAHLAIKMDVYPRPQVNVTIRHAACQLDERANDITCTFYSGSKSIEEDDDLNILFILFVVPFIIMLVVWLWCTIVKRKRKTSRRDQSQMRTRGQFPDPDCTVPMLPNNVENEVPHNNVDIESLHQNQDINVTLTIKIKTSNEDGTKKTCREIKADLMKQRIILAKRERNWST